VEETQENTHRWKETSSRALRAFPAVGAHVCGLSVRKRGAPRANAPYAASSASAEAARHGRRPRMPPPPTVVATFHLVAQRPGMLLVGQHVAGSFSGCLTYAPRWRAVKASPPRIPGIASVRTRTPRRRRHAREWRRRGAFSTSSGRPTMYRHQNEGLTRTPLRWRLSQCAVSRRVAHGPTLVVKHEALVDSRGKQLRMLATDRRQRLAGARRIGHRTLS